MPISDRLFSLTAAAGLLLLGACVQPLDEAGAPPQDGGDEVRRAVLVAGGLPVAIAPPRGYCIDPATLTETAVLAGECAALGVVVASRTAPEVLALFSAAASADPVAGTGSLRSRISRLETRLQSSRQDSPLAEDDGIARVVETRLRGDTLYALIEDGSASAFNGAANRFWRVMSEENGRMILLTVRALDQVWPGEQALLEKAVAFRESVRRANRGAV